MCYFQFILAGVPQRVWVPNKVSTLTKEHSINSICYVFMKARTLACTSVQEYLNSILKDQMRSPLSREISGFGLDLLLRKVSHSNEALWGLPQRPRCFYYEMYDIKDGEASLQRCYGLGSLKASLHWLSASGVFAWVAWRLPSVSQWSLCLPAWRKFSLVAVRLRPCLSCIYPLFIWRMSSAYSVWGGIVSWLLWSVLNATAVFLVVLVVGCLDFCIPTSVRKGVQTALKKSRLNSRK